MLLPTLRRRFFGDQFALMGTHKKLESHIYAISLYFVFYNFCRIHKTLKVTPAMAAAITDKLMSFEDICGLMDAAAPKPGRPKTYKKKSARPLE